MLDIQNIFGMKGGISHKSQGSNITIAQKKVKEALGINKTPASKQANYVPFKPVLQNQNSKLFDAFVTNLKKLSIGAVKSSNPTRSTKPAPVKSQRPVKMQQDMSDDDFLANAMKKQSISQKSRTAYNKKVKASKAKTEKSQREVQRRATAVRSSQRKSKPVVSYKPSESLKPKKITNGK